MIKKDKESIIIQENDVTIKANIREKILENINVGDTVNVYAEDFMPSYLPGENRPLIALSPIVQKVGEPIDSNYKKFTGKVVKKTGGALKVSDGKNTVSAKINQEVSQNINIGDTVNVYATIFVFRTMGTSFADGAVIEKLDAINTVIKILENINKLRK